MRICRCCKATESPIKPFDNNRNICKDCKREYTRVYRANHIEEIKQYNKQYGIEYRKDNREKIKLKSDNHHRINAAKKAQNWQDLKLEVMVYYGNGIAKCVLCPESRLAALHIDHINGNGKRHREQLGIGGHRIYLWLKNQGLPPGYRTLCANCNHLEFRHTLILSSNCEAVRKREDRQKIKNAVMVILGGACSICGTAKQAILTVNHINNNGAEHRRAISNGEGSTKFYKAILESNNFNGLECLCFSCNDATRLPQRRLGD